MYIYLSNKNIMVWNWVTSSFGFLKNRFSRLLLLVKQYAIKIKNSVFRNWSARFKNPFIAIKKETEEKIIETIRIEIQKLCNTLVTVDNTFRNKFLTFFRDLFEVFREQEHTIKVQDEMLWKQEGEISALKAEKLDLCATVKALQHEIAALEAQISNLRIASEINDSIFTLLLSSNDLDNPTANQSSAHQFRKETDFRLEELADSSTKVDDFLNSLRTPTFRY